MTIAEFMDWCYDATCCTVRVYDENAERIVWEGIAYKMPEALQEQRLSSFEPTGEWLMTLNIEEVYFK